MRRERGATMFCRYCGKQVPDDSAFCQHCGKQLGVSQKTLPSEPSEWQRMTVVIEFQKGEAGWVAQEKYTAPVAQQHFWNEWQPLIQDLHVMVTEEAWQPLGEHGPACVELESYKSTEGRSRMGMAVGAVATYGANLLFAKTWKFTVKSITLQWRRPAKEDSPSEREIRLRSNAQTGEWEPWYLDNTRNRWVLLDEESLAKEHRKSRPSVVRTRGALSRTRSAAKSNIRYSLVFIYLIGVLLLGAVILCIVSAIH